MSLKAAAEKVRRAGRGPDTELVHFTRGEVTSLKGLAAAAGGKLTRNPKTGLVEAGFLEQLLPTIIGGAVGMFTLNPMLGAAAGAATGAAQNKNDPLMGAISGGLGGYGGAGLAGGLGQLGAASTQAAAQAIQAPALANTVAQGAGSQAGMLAAQNAGFGAEGLASLAEAAGGTAPSAWQTAGYGLESAVSNPGGYIDALGGTTQALKTAGMAAAPMLMAPPARKDSDDEGEDEQKEVPRYRYNAGATGGERLPGAADTSEKLWFRPEFQRYAQGGGIASGAMAMNQGGFVFPADVVSKLGNGSSSAGLELLAKRYGASPIQGEGDGMSDSIPATVDGRHRAAVARDEAYMSPAQVKQAGGAKKLYAVMERVRKQAHGTAKQQRPVDARKTLA